MQAATNPPSATNSNPLASSSGSGAQQQKHQHFHRLNTDAVPTSNAVSTNPGGGDKSPSRPWGVGRDGRRLSKAQSMAVPGITGGGGEGETECNGDLTASRSSSTSSLDRTHPPSTSHNQQQHSPLSSDSRLNNKRQREAAATEPPPLDRVNTEFVTSFQFLQTHASRQQSGGGGNNGEPECTLWIGMSTGWCLALRIHLPPAGDRLVSNVVVAPSGRRFFYC